MSTSGLIVGQTFIPYGLFYGVWIPQAILSVPNVSPGSKLLYGLLNRYAGADGDCHPAVETLGAQMGVSERQIQRYLRELEGAGLIKIVERFKAPGVHDTSGYLFLWHECLAESVRKGTRVSPPLVTDMSPPLVTDMSPPLVTDMSPKENPLKESPLKREKSFEGGTDYKLEPPRPKLSDDQRLIRVTAKSLYDRHPEHRRGSLDGTEAALRIIAKMEPGPVSRLLDRIRKQHSLWLASNDWANPKFVHGLRGWLVDGTWEKNPSAAKKPEPEPYRPAYPEFLEGGRVRFPDGTLREKDGTITPVAV